MRDGYLLQLGYRIPRSRIEASYLRVVGPSPATFGPRRIQRRSYSVPGPMALVHHDGQHGESCIGSVIKLLIYSQVSSAGS